MNANQIARALQSTRDSAGIHLLRAEVTARQTEIRDRIVAIQQSGNTLFPSPKARLAAIARGPAAVAELDEEIKLLNAELDYVAELEREIYAEHDAAEKREIAAEIPASLRRLPVGIRKVREACHKLDEAIAEIRTSVESIGSYDRIGMPFPLSDADCAELLELRNALWVTRLVPALIPPGMDVNSKERFPLSWPLAFKKHAEHGGDHYSPRRPPQFMDLLDLGVAER